MNEEQVQLMEKNLLDVLANDDLEVGVMALERILVASSHFLGVTKKDFLREMIFQWEGFENHLKENNDVKID